MIRSILNASKFKLYFFLFFFSIFIRITINNYLSFDFPDAIAYRNIADELIKNFYYASDSSMPLYPIIMALSKYLFNNFYVFDFIISSLFPIVIYSLTYTIFKNHYASLISGITCSLYPMNIFYSISGLTENFYVFFLF